jgi:hypothetical protein
MIALNHPLTHQCLIFQIVVIAILMTPTDKEIEEK